MKILVVGDGGSKIHEVNVAEAFRKLGHQVDVFYWNNYFQTGNFIAQQWLRAQNKFIYGPKIIKINQELVAHARSFIPDLIFIYRGTHVTPATLSQLKIQIPSCRIFGYNNDDPFSPGHSSRLWRYFIDGLRLYDIVFAYRPHNIDDLLCAGAKRVELLRSWYIPEIHKQVVPSREELSKYGCDCIFIGHYEADGRDFCIEGLLKNGIKVKVFGPYRGLGRSGWDTPVAKSEILKSILPITYLIGSSYVSALCSAPIALCFLSKLNKDSYTRRCFEIPATGTALFSEYSDDLAGLFKDGEEAVFFKNSSELIDKVKYYLRHRDKLDAIRKRGRERVIRDGHDIYSRVKTVLSFVEPL